MLKAIHCRQSRHRQHCPHHTSQNQNERPMSLRNLSRRGLTLVEILIALTMTLIVLGAMAQAFKFASAEIADGRSILEMSNRLRNAQQLLRTDLAGLTVKVIPHTANAPTGYFEYVEGAANDSTQIGTANGYLGDWDDYLAFTSRKLDGTFRGRFDGDVILSTHAEIIWFTEALDINSDGNEIDLGTGTPLYSDTVALYRRELLIRPDRNRQLTQTDANGNPFVGIRVAASADELTEFLARNDISVRLFDIGGGEVLVTANSLADLARREYRFGRVPSSDFPHQVNFDQLVATKPTDGGGFLTGNEILLTDLAAFDVQVYSPNTTVELVDIDGNGINETALSISDVGYDAGGTLSASGGYVDLGIGGGGRFAGDPQGKSQIGIPTLCTWSPHYESDGIDQDNSGVADQGTDGFDNDADNGVDDNGEWETLPPYLFPARGIKVTFRIIEKNSKQVRQTSVVQNFLPQ